MSDPGRKRARSAAGALAEPLQRLAQHPVFRWVTLSALAAVAVWALRPLGESRVEFSSDWVGRIAPHDVVTNHYFEVEGATDAEVAPVREAAAAQVLPVWDFDPSRLDETRASVRDAFDRVRAALRQEAVARVEALRAGEGSGAAEGSAAPLPSESVLLTLLTIPERAAVARREGALDTLGPEDAPPFPDEALRALATSAFSLETEDALLTLIEPVLSRQIVADRAALDEIGGEGVVLRSMIGGEVAGERTVRNLRDFVAATEIDDHVYAALVRLRGDRDPDELDALVVLANRVVVPNTAFNATETAGRRGAAADDAERRFRSRQRAKYVPGEHVVSQGEVVTPQVLAALEQMRATAPPRPPVAIALVGLTGLLMLALGPLVEFARRNLRHFSVARRDVWMMATVLVGHLLTTRLALFLALSVSQTQELLAFETLLLFTPFALGAMLVRVLSNAENALVYAVGYALLCGVFHEADAAITLAALCSGVAATTALGAARSRTDVLQSGAIAGVLLGGAMLAVRASSGEMPETDWAWIAGAAIVSGLMSAAIATALLPFFEGAFRYTTALRLMELANLNHPALRDLVMKAPGTYHHSMMVGQLVEAACEAVGADALLGRVGSYFHDIGKTRNPHYFAENQSGSNPHSRLKPQMSALVIRAHVKDGVELARQYKLPDRIVDFIREHHGSSLIAYFYHRAQQEGGEVDEQTFRYAGPRPQSRETAICMLADGIEAASRAMPDPTPARLKGLVKKMVDRAFADGQLDECDLSLQDLGVIREAFLTRLTAFYHHRPEYPDARQQRGRREGDRAWVTELTTEESDALATAGDGVAEEA